MIQLTTRAAVVAVLFSVLVTWAFPENAALSCSCLCEAGR